MNSRSGEIRPFDEEGYGDAVPAVLPVPPVAVYSTFGLQWVALADVAAAVALLNISPSSAAGTLTGTTLAANVVTSSLTGVGTIVTGVWNGTAIADAYIASAATWNAKQTGDATLTALAGLTIAANSLTIGTGVDAFSQTTFAANTFPARASTGDLVAKTITDFGLSLADDADATAARTTLGLGALATQSVPVTITVADTTDSTCYVGLWESATGDLAPKTDAALTYNAATGQLGVPIIAFPAVDAISPQIINGVLAGGPNPPTDSDRELLIRVSGEANNVLALQNTTAGVLAGGFSAITMREKDGAEMMAFGYANTSGYPFLNDVHYLELSNFRDLGGTVSPFYICFTALDGGGTLVNPTGLDVWQPSYSFATDGQHNRSDAEGLWIAAITATATPGIAFQNAGGTVIGRVRGNTSTNILEMVGAGGFYFDTTDGRMLTISQAGAAAFAGAITAASFNGNTFTTGTGTLTIAAGKTLTASNTLTFAGTDGSTLNVGAGGTLGAAALVGTSAGGNGAADSGKALVFSSVGELNATLSLTIQNNGVVPASIQLSGYPNSTIAKIQPCAASSGIRTIETPNADTAILISAYHHTLSGPTAAHAYTLPDADASFAILGANTFTGQQIISLNGAASKPPDTLTGTWFTGGTATTTKPQFLIEPAGTTSTAWSTSGTGLGINAATGFVGNLIDMQLAGVSKFKVSSDGAVSCGATITSITSPLVVASTTASYLHMHNDSRLNCVGGFGVHLTSGGSSLLTAAATGVQTFVQLIIGSGGTGILKSATYTAAMSASVSAASIGTQTVTATGVAAGDTFAIEIPQQSAGLVLAGVRGDTDQILVDFYNTTAGSLSLSGTVKLRSFEV